ncbi:hypothetical protein [Mucilaginibacter myungsuensis]|uniref:Histidine kinase n=1 Tax=Mucilaginibacter myungsuensis TaxID=649104 RepID=A0A929PY17_9SPHI|nr:hypothetical protein [Mucilaginibacter myungsuensis]MBE9664428.1 hypothetical protein [Mucilaginibacter myungsuensis]MDN3597139.1 hypothetical protein [Mucilaginibacter myungsuensis]
MNNFLIILLLLISVTPAIAQNNTDSAAYQLQRKKINEMLATREQRFGQYTESLSQHTGIFGLQTKKDIRRSNEILMEITKTDESIFRETKILLDYRVFEQQKVESKSNELQETVTAYMTTINKLRAQVTKLNADIETSEKAHDRSTTILYVIVGILILSLLYLLTRKRPAKT